MDLSSHLSIFEVGSLVVSKLTMYMPINYELVFGVLYPCTYIHLFYQGGALGVSYLSIHPSVNMAMNLDDVVRVSCVLCLSMCPSTYLPSI